MSVTHKNKTNMKIRIRRRYRYFKVKNIVTILCLITISLMSGAIGAEFITDRNISKLSLEKEQDYNSDSKLVKNDYTKVIDKVSRSVVTISSSDYNFDGKYHGDNITGIVVDSNGYIVTKLSKIKSYDKIYVKLSTKGSPVIEGHLVGKDNNSDIAVIKIVNENLEPIKLADADSVNNGDNVLIIGNATASDNIGMCTSGIITSINQKNESGNACFSLIETNAIINELNDAGPICNMDGNLIGVSSNDLSKKYNNQGLYYGINITKIKEIIENSISLESIIGITGKEIDIESGKSGLYIETLVPNGYAAKAGIKSSDILVKIDDKDIDSNEDVYEAIKDKESGDSAICDILRNGEKIKITINFD